MPRERLPMRKIRDVLRLHADKLSKRRIAVSVNLGRTAVRDYIKRATRVGLSWPLGLAGACVPAVMDDGQHMVAILNPDNEAILFGFGKDQSGYFVFDWDGRPLIEGCPNIDEILAVFK